MHMPVLPSATAQSDASEEEEWQHTVLEGEVDGRVGHEGPQLGHIAGARCKEHRAASEN